MQLTQAQKRGLKETDRNVLLKENMYGRGHMYDLRGEVKLLDARVINSLQSKGLIEWNYDWGYDDHKLVLTEKGHEIQNQN